MDPLITQKKLDKATKFTHIDCLLNDELKWKLLEGVKMFGKNWKKISEHVGSMTSK